MNLALLLALAALRPQDPAEDPGPATPAADSSVSAQVAREALAIRAAVDAWAAGETRLADAASPDGRLQIRSDFSAADAREAVKRSTAVLARLDRAFGAPPAPQEAQLCGILLRSPRLYSGLCAAIAAAAPSQAEFMQRSAATTGFTLYAPPLTVYFHDEKVQKEARADHSLAHSLAHLELARRFGELPLWLTEGIATAGEDGAWGEVWANWYRDGFVTAASHKEWRGKETQRVVAAQQDLAALFAYSARPYQDEGARLSFAFATYGLDAEPERFAAFLLAVQDAYSRQQPAGGRSSLAPEQAAALLEGAFGADFMTRFQLWWQKPPRWNAKRSS